MKKMAIKPWQMAKMRKIDFDELFSKWKKQYPNIASSFNRKSFVVEIGEKYGFLITAVDGCEYSGIEFANMIAGCYDINENQQNFIYCAFCVQFVTKIQRISFDEIKVNFKNKK